MKALASLALACLLTVSVSGVCAAEEGELDYSYGTVVKVDLDGRTVVISEYDWEKESDIEVTYYIDKGAAFKNFTSLEELAAGSSVDIDYVERNGKKTATLIDVFVEE